MKQDNTVTMLFFRGLRLAGAEEMQPAGDASKVFSKKLGLFLASDTSDRLEDIMHDIINSTKKSDFSDFLLGLSEKACVTGMWGQSFSIKNRKSQPLRPAFFEKEGEEAMISSKKSKNLPSKRTFLLPTFHMCVWQGKENRSSGRKMCQDSLFSPADIDRGQHMPTTTKKDKAMKAATITDSGSKPKRKRSGILAGLSNLPIVNFFTSSAKKVTDSDWTEQESTLESKIENLSLNFKNSTKGSNMHNALHISPYFIPGMKLGDILFPIAAVVAHSRRIKVECRIPWAYSEETRELHAALGMNALPSTLCGANEALAYEEESYLYTPIPETVDSGGLCGYFQSGNYFAGIEPVIRHLFAPLTAVDKTPGTVGIHITIGNDPYKYSTYRLSTALFLQKAAARLSKDIREIVVFSDKPCEAVAMLVEFPEFAQYSFRVDQSKPCEQLRRMTAMQELLISNSALSWWAAWLGKPRKVLAPRCWFMHKAEQPPVFEDSPWIVL